MTEEERVTASTQRRLDEVRHGGRAFRINTIHTRLLIAFVLMVLLLAASIGAVTAIEGIQSGRQRVINQLQSVATLKEAEIEAWVNRLRTNLKIVASEQRVLRRLIVLTQESVDPADYQDAYSEMKGHFDWAVEHVGLFEELFMMDLQGRVVLSTDAAQEGEIYSNQVYFQRGLKGVYVQPPTYSLSLGRMSVVVVRPIEDGQGQVLGVLAGRATLEMLNQIMLERPRGNHERRPGQDLGGDGHGPGCGVPPGGR